MSTPLLDPVAGKLRLRLKRRRSFPNQLKDILGYFSGFSVHTRFDVMVLLRRRALAIEEAFGVCWGEIKKGKQYLACSRLCASSCRDMTCLAASLSHVSIKKCLLWKKRKGLSRKSSFDAQQRTVQVLDKQSKVRIISQSIASLDHFHLLSKLSRVKW